MREVVSQFGRGGFEDGGRSWYTADSDTKPMLVVTKLPPGAVCPVAYVDAAANPDADDLARQAADQIARDFKCGTDQPKVLGTSGRTAEFATKR